MTSKNMEIWNSVSKTDTSATKHGFVNGQTITTINGLYVAKRATEVFGPCGKGWGYSIIEERYDNAGPIIEKDSDKHLCDALNHTIVLEIWYKDGDDRCTVTHFGHTKYIYKSSRGFSVDDEAPKKSLTDALKKCFSMLGICADIYLGQFDDSNYVDSLKEQEAIENAENKAEEITRIEMEYKDWMNTANTQILESVSMSMLEGCYKSAVRKATIRNDSAAIKKFTESKTKCIDRLKKVKANDPAV